MVTATKKRDAINDQTLKERFEIMNLAQESNFDFAKDELAAEIIMGAKAAETSFAKGEYTSTFNKIRIVIEVMVDFLLRHYQQTTQRKLAENDVRGTLARRIDVAIAVGEIDSVMVKNYLTQLRLVGNAASHEIKEYTEEKALAGLYALANIITWLYNRQTDGKKTVSFKIPQLLEFQTTKKNLIYATSVPNAQEKHPDYVGYEKIGKASYGDDLDDASANSEELRMVADKRVGSYMKTAGLKYQIDWAEKAYSKERKLWFSDSDIHRVLQKSGYTNAKRDITTELDGVEWYPVDVATVKAAITAFKQNKTSLQQKAGATLAIKLRAEQQAAVDKTAKYFKKKKNQKMLWNAKMRFGKTLSALQLIKQQKYPHVLIMTHRPNVNEGWFEDFKKIGLVAAGYRYGSKTRGDEFSQLVKNSHFIYFASLQDLRGSEAVGGRAGAKNQALFATKWDLVIVDEAHEGTQTNLAQNVLEKVVGKDTKVLNLSGTPFNLKDEYSEENTFTWDYTMEQQAKQNWHIDHPGQANPYAGLPKVEMFTFAMNESVTQNFSTADKAFNFAEFFRVGDDGKFVHEASVRQFLDNITTPSETTNYPFATQKLRNNLRHTLWLLPSVAAAAALEKMLQRHPVFGLEYNIVNVVDQGDGETKESDAERVRNAMKPDPATTKTITLTVRKLTTGTTIKPWTGVLFLANIDSAATYLQAAFRAQTPYSSETFGQKTTCYIFDFAPDRALTMMAAANRLNTGAGRLAQVDVRDNMRQMLNFLPIIGQDNHGMKTYQIDTLMAQLKRVYAQRAVNAGFDDNSLYNDELLKVTADDIEAFADLKKIIGTTKQAKQLKLDINASGLSDEEYDQALAGKAKKVAQRSAEELAAIKKMEELKKQKSTLISILRSISIRIPLMLYGADVKEDENISLKRFASKDFIDDQSWAEFMPKGVTRAVFKRFTKYYDADVFIEAGRIIRKRVKAIDDLDPLERSEKLAEIFATFKNPDKETVLTPWRVVNMQLAGTLGGLNHYDENFEYTTKDALPARHWEDTDYATIWGQDDVKILEINAKTGLYPLYAALSLYYQRTTAHDYSQAEKTIIWKQILNNNIYVVAKTPMAAAIANRTLRGYHDYHTNIAFIDGIAQLAKQNLDEATTKVKEALASMKFDVVIGNPPYQEESKGGQDNYHAPIYNEFMNLSYELAPVAVLITPGRFLFDAGSTPKAWNRKMLNDPHLKVVKYITKSSDVFPRTDIKGGVAITLRDENKNFGSIKDNYAPAVIFVKFDELHQMMKKVFDENFESFSDIIYGRNIYRFTDKMHEDFPEAKDKLSKGHAYDLSSNIFVRLPEIFSDENPSPGDYVGVMGREENMRVIKYMKREYMKPVENLNAYKVFVPKANGSGALGERLSTPLIGSTETFISIGAFKTRNEAENCMKYIKTKFARVMLGALKTTQDNTSKTWRCVPLQDFTANSDIDWAQSIEAIDRQLYAKYGLSDEEIAFIEAKVAPMN